MPVTSAPMTSPRKESAPPIGVIPPGSIERAFLALLYVMVLLLAWLSVLGTFYGMRGLSAHLLPLAQLADIQAAPPIFVQALAIQIVLTLAQWGGRQMARRSPWWWIVYLVALGISVYYNVQAYYGPLTALALSPVVAYVLIVVGDVLPEFIAVRHR